MPENGVCAVVITFRPTADVVSNLTKTRLQVQNLIAVDNGSSVESLTLVRAAGRQFAFTLIENETNMGVAAALNIGVRAALDQAFRWIVLLDQDSTLTEGFVSQMLDDFHRESARKKLMLLVPRYRDPNTGVERVFPLEPDGGPLVTITS